MAMQQQIVLVTRSISVRDFVERSLLTAGIPVHHETSAAEGGRIARENGSICLCTPEVEWRNIVAEFAKGDQPSPPVILLLATNDESVWARALRAGAFDAVRLADGSDHLLRALQYADAHWRRQRSVRTAMWGRTSVANGG